MTAATGLPMTWRVCVVTGASSGIGKAASIALAKLGASVVLVCRDRVRGEAAITRVTSAAVTGGAAPSLELADLASLGQVRALAARLARLPRVDVLVNNAGLIGSRLAGRRDRDGRLLRQLQTPEPVPYRSRPELARRLWDVSARLTGLSGATK